MKISRVSFLPIILLLVSCSSIATASPIRLTPTFAKISTSTALPTPTATTVPIYTDISCKPSENPWAEIPEMYSYEKPYLPNIPISKICSFEGRVSRGQAYRHLITDNLILCLVPRIDGWYLTISDLLPGSCEDNSKNFADFTSMLNPPFHGNTTSLLFGSYFRNQNNTENIDGGFKRYMNFVFNREDSDTTYSNAACAMWRIDTDCARATQTSSNTDVARSRGVLTITKLELGNLIPNEHAWIESMEFTFEVYLADE